MVENARINFSISPYCTLLFSRKENFKFFEVALSPVLCNGPVGCIMKCVRLSALKYLQVLMILSKNEISILPKKAYITPVFKKGDRNSKDNYRPVSMLPNLSKIFEQCIFCQFYSFMLEFLPTYQCGFCRG